VTPEEELDAAIAGRPHWRREGRLAVFAPPGVDAVVEVRPVAVPTHRERYRAAIIRGNRAEHSTPWSTAVQAVAWAERVRL
jgi:hypothetical protein